jgi:predicted DNA-binding transcriptional regulator AlpA
LTDISTASTERLIGRREVLNRVPLSYPTIWSMMRAGTFPRSKQIGARIFWIEREVDAWIASLPDQTYKAADPEPVPIPRKPPTPTSRRSTRRSSARRG